MEITNNNLDDSMTSKSSKSISSGNNGGSDKEIFEKARRYLNLGPAYRVFTHLFAERKLLIFFWVHFICTMVIWAHFALTKFTEQENKVPAGASRYWWKRLAPPLEFGSMHAILFQMALIPLTMARYSISALSGSILDHFLPLNRAVRIHIHLGYTMVGIVFCAVIFFFAFFGLLCSDGDQSFCDKFTEEIMITGYFILGFLLIIGGTSYYRHRIPYEVFYAIHHLVFILYFLTIAHTIDVVQRTNERQRSQSFKWFSSTLLFYFCDRAAMHLNQKFRARIESSSVVSGRKNRKMIILRLKRPILFHFKPGQYAFLRLKDIDVHWHPFSIASDPASQSLEFYVEVFGETSWTRKLWNILQIESKVPTEARQIEFEVMGPYGTTLAKTEDFSHALAIGAGTGIVPILSLFKKHVRQLMSLDPKTYLAALGEHRAKQMEIEREIERRQGSIVSKIKWQSARESGTSRDEAGSRATVSKNAQLSESIRCHFTRHAELKRLRDIRQNMRDVRRETFIANKLIYGIVLQSAMPVFGVALLGLTISWNTVDFEMRHGMIEGLQAMTVIFQVLFVFIALFLWEGNHLFSYIDAAISVVSPFSTWYWFLVYSEKGLLSGTDILTYCLLIGYMTARVWNMTVKSHNTSSERGYTEGGLISMERMELVWVTRSALLVSQVLPDITEMWEGLVESWGEEDAINVCRISIYVTDPDPIDCALLRTELTRSTLRKCVTFSRPDLSEIIEDHTLELISSCEKSTSLLAFCGSPQLSKEIHHDKISNDMLSAVTGHKQHQMVFVSESYGGTKKQYSKPAKECTEEELAFKDNSSLEDSELSTNSTQRVRLLPEKHLKRRSSIKDVAKRLLTRREVINFAPSKSESFDSIEIPETQFDV